MIFVLFLCSNVLQRPVYKCNFVWLHSTTRVMQHNWKTIACVNTLERLISECNLWPRLCFWNWGWSEFEWLSVANQLPPRPSASALVVTFHQSSSGDCTQLSVVFAVLIPYSWWAMVIFFTILSIYFHHSSFGSDHHKSALFTFKFVWTVIIWTVILIQRVHTCWNHRKN